MSQEIMQTVESEVLEPRSLVEALMIRNSGKWLRFVQRMVQNREDAEDVLQEAALRMLLSGKRFSSQDQARMYLGRIVSNTAIELYHRRRRCSRRQGPVLEQLLPARCAVEPGHGLWVREDEEGNSRLRALLNEGLKRLPVKQYEALRLTIMTADTVSMRDTGVAHNIPYSTLRHRCIQGIRRLRRFLRHSMRADTPGGWSRNA